MSRIVQYMIVPRVGVVWDDPASFSCSFSDNESFAQAVHEQLGRGDIYVRSRGYFTHLDFLDELPPDDPIQLKLVQGAQGIFSSVSAIPTHIPPPFPV